MHILLHIKKTLAIYNPRHWNLGIGIEIGIGIGTDTTHAFISSSIMAMRGPTHKVIRHIVHVVKWQIKNVISLLSQGLWSPNLAG